MLTGYGLTLIPAGRASIIAFTMPVWAAILSSIFLGERVTLWRILGLILGMAGMAVLIGPDLRHLETAPWGALLMLGAAITWAGGIVSIKSVSWSISPGAQAGWQLLIASVPISIGAFFLDGPPDFSTLSTDAYLALAYVLIMLPFAKGWSISEAILTAGQATADNLPHSVAQIQYLWRTPTVEMAEAVLRVLDANAETAARMAHCTVRGAWVTKSRPGLANHALAEACYENLKRAGPPHYGPEAVALAQEVQKNCGLDPMDAPFLEACSRLIDPVEAEEILRRDLPPSQINSTSDDYTDMHLRN